MRAPDAPDAMSGCFEGAQLSARPPPPCAQVTTGRPPCGAGPVGATTTPETAMSWPSTAREWYRIFHARAPAGAAIGVDRMIVPGLAFLRGWGGT